MARVELIILGAPMGKQRPKVSVLGTSKFAHAYTPKETINYENKVVHEFEEWLKENQIAIGEMVFEQREEIEATIIAYFEIQKAHYGRKGLKGKGIDKLEGRINPTKAPDCDNIAKICLDALNGIAYKDDSQITRLTVEKKYAIQPRVEIILESRCLDGN